MLGKMDARVDAIHAFTRADISVYGITECIVVAVDVVRLPDLFQLIRRRDRLANSRLYVQWPQMKNTISGSVKKPFFPDHTDQFITLRCKISRSPSLLTPVIELDQRYPIGHIMLQSLPSSLTTYITAGVTSLPPTTINQCMYPICAPNSSVRCSLYTTDKKEIT